MKANAKWAWLLRQTGTVAEMSALQACVIATNDKPTTVDGGREFAPYHVWMSPGEIARRTGLNERTVPSVMRRLQQRGLIEVAGRYGRTGQIKVYRLPIEEEERTREPSTFGELERAKELASFDSSEGPKEGALFPDVERPKVSAGKSEGSCIERAKVPASAYIEEKRQQKRQVKPKGISSTIQLPSVINREAWDAYIETRRANRKKTTQRAKQLLIAKLVGMALKGHDPNQALENATIGCWSSVYPPKAEDRTEGGRQSQASRQTNFGEINYFEGTVRGPNGELRPA